MSLCLIIANFVSEPKYVELLKRIKCANVSERGDFTPIAMLRAFHQVRE